MTPNEVLLKVLEDAEKNDSPAMKKHRENIAQDFIRHLKRHGVFCTCDECNEKYGVITKKQEVSE